MITIVHRMFQIPQPYRGDKYVFACGPVTFRHIGMVLRLLY